MSDFTKSSAKIFKWDVSLILLAFIALATIYSLVLPLGEASDERYHFKLVRFIAETKRPPITVAERQALGQKGDAAPFYHGLVALLTQHVDISNLPALPVVAEKSERLITFDGLPFVWLFHTDDEAFPFHDIVLAWHLARLVSVPLGVATLLAVYLTSLAIYPDRRYLALAAMAFVAFLPGFMTNSAVVSDDNLVTPLIAFAIYYLVCLVQGQGSAYTAGVLGSLMGLAAIVKYHSLVLVPEVAVVFLFLAWRRPQERRTWLRRLAWASGLFVMVSGWWFLFLFIRFNQIAELGLIRGTMTTLGDPVLTSGVNSLFEAQGGRGSPSNFLFWDWLGLTFKTFWIVYGTFYVLAPPLVYRGLAFLCLAAAGGWLGLSLTQSGSPAQQENLGRPSLILLGMHFSCYFTLMLARYLSQHLSETAQGRHLYPAMTAISLFFVLGLGQAWQFFRQWPGRWRTNPSPAATRWHYEREVAIGVTVIMVGLSVVTPWFFILPAYERLPIIRTHQANIAIDRPMAATPAEGIEFRGYNLRSSPVEAGDVLALSLYWRVKARQPRDYLIRVCLQDLDGRLVTCHQGHPVDGRYPVRAWEAGSWIRDDLFLPIPACIMAGEYSLALTFLPLRLDAPFSIVNPDEDRLEPLPIGQVMISGGMQQPVNDTEIWAGGKRYIAGALSLDQLRQQFSVVTYQQGRSVQPQGAEQVTLVADGIRANAGDTWTPIADRILYPCPDKTVVAIDNFILDAGVRPGSYHLIGATQRKLPVTILVKTRYRNFTLPTDLPPKLEASFGEQATLLALETDLSPRLPGEAITFTLHWRTLRSMSEDYIGSFHLLDYTVTSYGQADQILGGPYRNILWAPGEIVSEEYRLSLDRAIPPGLYTVQFGVYDYALGQFDFLPVTTPTTPESAKQLTLGQVRVIDPAQNTPPDQLLRVILDDQIALQGYSFSVTNGENGHFLDLRLDWQALRPLTNDYTVFTQLISPDGLVWSQQDNQPQAGRYPTSRWNPQELVIDRYHLTLPEDAPTGQYRLWIGMYELSTGRRLAAYDSSGNRLSADAIELTTVPFE